MARKPMDLPAGIELRNGAIRIRFARDGKRCSETLTLPATQPGIAAAARLRDQVINLAKLGLLTDAKYAELFPGSITVAPPQNNPFGVYAQKWMNGRSFTEGTHKNYTSALNHWWMPRIATTDITCLTSSVMRGLVGEIEWTSSSVKANAMIKLKTILGSAVLDGIIDKNPMDDMDVPKRKKKEADPFTQIQAEKIIATLYAAPHWPIRIYGAYFEFAFYTGMRPAEILALKWERVDMDKRVAHVCRIVAKGKVVDRTKTKKDRYVLLNDRAMHALTFAKGYAERRKAGEGALTDFPHCFPPSKNSEYVKDTSDLHLRWRSNLETLKIRYRAPYNARHTYATMCLMAGMAPAFIAQQLGNSVQELLSTYARWINSRSDWAELEKLNTAPKMPQEDDSNKQNT